MNARTSVRGWSPVLQNVPATVAAEGAYVEGARTFESTTRLYPAEMATVSVPAAWATPEARRLASSTTKSAAGKTVTHTAARRPNCLALGEVRLVVCDSII